MSLLFDEDLTQSTNRGRGFHDALQDGRYAGDAGRFDVLQNDSNQNPNIQKSSEGWVLFVTGINPDTEPELIPELFENMGEVIQVRAPLSRTTGELCGFALVEYAEYSAAQDAIDQLNGCDDFGILEIDWAFSK